MNAHASLTEFHFHSCLCYINWYVEWEHVMEINSNLHFNLLHFYIKKQQWHIFSGVYYIFLAKSSKEVWFKSNIKTKRIIIVISFLKLCVLIGTLVAQK
jgi:hypothetical protein